MRTVEGEWRWKEGVERAHVVASLGLLAGKLGTLVKTVEEAAAALAPPRNEPSS